MKCSGCGSEALVSGTILDSNGSRVNFKLDDVSTWKSMLGIGTRGVRAYGCLHCQNLQFGVDFTEKDLKQYQQFEGQQPSVLERINSETDAQ
ncbi:MAG: hypothetical protein QUS14_00285 [Pyrinomonadaceae bacterium]|nr:hypothetical protein [Pyrinomonadaceae bacterium]